MTIFSLPNTNYKMSAPKQKSRFKGKILIPQTSAAAQNDYTSTIFKGTDQGAYKVFCQTIPPYSVSQAYQTNPMISIAKQEERMICDLLFQKGYEHILQHYLSFSFTTNNIEKVSKEFTYTIKPSFHHTQTSLAQSRPSCAAEAFPSGIGVSDIGPAFMKHKFNPEQCLVEGPKHIRNVNKIHSISSMKMITEPSKL